MRPYLAIIKDSFREALASRVLWVLFGLISLALLGFAPLTYRETVTVGLHESDVEGWPLLIEKLRGASQNPTVSPARRVWSLLDDDGKKVVRNFKAPPPQPTMRDVGDMQRAGRTLFKSLDKAVRRDDFYDEESWKDAPKSRELKQLQKTSYEKLSQQDRLRANRLLLEAAFPDIVENNSATSLMIRYGVWDLSQPFPIRKDQFTEALFKKFPYYMDKFVLSIGLLIAVLVTAPIIPQMFDPSSLHLLLSKPIARPLLYLSKFAGGCAFVLLAAAYLFVGLWFILGVQWNIWEPQVLWCIPVYVFAFAIYYSVAALAGAIWRNTIVAVMVTVAFWGVCFSVGAGHSWIGGIIFRYRIDRIVPAGEALVAADELNTLLVWNDEKHSWKPLFTSKEHEQIRSMSILLPVPVPPPMIGPAYDAKNEQIVATAPSFKMFGRMVMLSARKDVDWKATGGAPPRGQPIALLHPTGQEPLLIASTGVSRVVRDLAESAVMLRLPGFSIPLTRAEALQEAGPSPSVYWGGPAAATIDSETGRLFVYSGGVLTALVKGKDGEYSVGIEKQIADDENSAVVLAAGGERCWAAFKDGKIDAFSASDLAAVAEYQLPGGSSPRDAAVTPDGKWLLILAHDGMLYELNLQSGKFSRFAVRGQGNISALTVTPTGKLYVASRATRVSEIDLGTRKETRVFAPALNLQERIYYYAIRPAHALLPKPGELYKTVQYLLSGQETTGNSDDNLAAAQVKLDPWSPIYSGIAFQAVMLLLGCLYIHWQEF